METTSKRVVAISKPRNHRRAHLRPAQCSIRAKSISPQTNKNNSNVTSSTIRKQGVKPLAYVQETINNAFGLFFETSPHLNVTFVSDGNVMTVTCTANGLTATLTMSGTMEGGIS